MAKKALDLSDVEHLRLRSYVELEEWAKLIPQKKWKLIVLVGNPGLGKSRTVKEALKPYILNDADADRTKPLWINGHTTPLMFYAGLHDTRGGGVVVLDDARSVLQDKLCVEMLMAATGSEDAYRVIWNSTRNVDGDNVLLDRSRKLPRSFQTTGQVVIIVNDLKILRDRLDAAIDRGFVLLADFPATEVHRKAGEWFPHQKESEGQPDHDRRQGIAKEIYAFIEKCLPMIPSPSLRYYVKALDLALAGDLTRVQWRAVLLELWGLSRNKLIAIALKLDPRYADDAERIQQFELRTGMKRERFYEYNRALIHTEMPDDKAEFQRLATSLIRSLDPDYLPPGQEADHQLEDLQSERKEEAK